VLTHNLFKAFSPCAVIVLLALTASSEAAVRKDAAVSFRLDHDSNVNLTDPEQSNTGFVFGGDVGLTQTSARFNSQLRLRLERELNSDVADETRPSGYLSSRMTIIRNKLFWTFNDTFSQVRVNPLGADVIDNTANSNTLSTGPDLVIPFSASTQFRLSARHDRMDYDTSVRVDRSRDNASAFLSHAFSPRWSTTLSHEVTWESFDFVDRELSTSKAAINHNGKRLNWSVASGRSEVEGGLLDSDIRDASLRFRITPNSAFFASYSLSINSDISGTLSFANDRLNDISFLAGECTRELGGEVGACTRLPGVTAFPVDDLLWLYQRENLPGYLLSEQALLESYLREFSFDSALFESEVYNVGLQLQLKRVLVQLTLRNDEQKQTFDAISGSALTSPEILTTESVNVTASFPVSGRLGAQLGYLDRKPKLETLLGITATEERRGTAMLTWTVEPRLYAFFSVNYSEFDSNDTGTRDNQNYALGFRYRLQ